MDGVGHFPDRTLIGYPAEQDQSDPHGVVLAVITRPIMRCSNGDACGAVTFSGPGTNLQPSFMIAKDDGARRSRGNPAAVQGTELGPYVAGGLSDHSC